MQRKCIQVQHIGWRSPTKNKSKQNQLNMSPLNNTTAYIRQKHQTFIVVKDYYLENNNNHNNFQ